MDLAAINKTLRHESPAVIIRWAMSVSKRPIATTSFGKTSAVLIHALQNEIPKLPLIWVDHGYNLKHTYQYVEEIIGRFNPNLQVYTPRVTTERRLALTGGVPLPEDDEAFSRFTQEVKLEPFQRAIEEHQPDVWLTGISKYETDYRKTLDIVSIDHRGLLRVAPFFYWQQRDIEAYLQRHNLPSPKHYFDPTKLSDSAECGLHKAS